MGSKTSSVTYDVLHSDEEEPEVTSTQPEQQTSNASLDGSDRQLDQYAQNVHKQCDKIKIKHEINDENEVSSASIEATGDMDLNEAVTITRTMLPKTQSDECSPIQCGQRIIQKLSEPDLLADVSTDQRDVHFGGQVGESNPTRIEDSVKKQEAQKTLIELKNMFLEGKLNEDDMKTFRNIIGEFFISDVKAAKTDTLTVDKPGKQIESNVCATAETKEMEPEPVIPSKAVPQEPTEFANQTGEK